MLKVPYTSSGFSATYGSALSGNKVCQCSWPRIIHAAVTVGKAERPHLFRYGAYSRFEIISRASLIYANLMENSVGHVLHTDVNRALDPTEKGYVSYFLGLTTAKMLAGQYLRVPWLMHLDVYRDYLLPLPPAGSLSKEKPDLVGRDLAGRWVVLEAKGRSGGLTPGLLEKAKDQTRNLSTVRGNAIDLRVALASYFKKDRLSVKWEDPVEPKEDAPQLDISVDQLLREYYRPFFLLFSQEQESDTLELNGRAYRTVRIADADLVIGINVPILEALREERLDQVENLARELARTNTSPGANSALEADEATFLGDDGILVRAGVRWNSVLMSHEPEKRGHLFK